MNSLWVRVTSGVIAGVSLLLVGIYGGTKGIAWVSFAIVALGIREYTAMAFTRIAAPVLFRAWFILCSLLVLGGVFYFFNSALLVLALLSAVFFSGGLWLTRNRYPNVRLLTALAMGNLGLVYFVSFPAMAIKSLFLPHGITWFTLLLIVVFFGDTFAYFGGRFFGKTPLMPEISPKKTWEGAVGGLIGSGLSGVIFITLTLPDIPWYWTAAFSLTCGWVAQSGDLVVSLVKRVAEVKDSGRIMPGHGGILDRLDGIYIASPVVYAFAKFCESLL